MREEEEPRERYRRTEKERGREIDSRTGRKK